MKRFEDELAEGECKEVAWVGKHFITMAFHPVRMPSALALARQATFDCDLKPACGSRCH